MVKSTGDRGKFILENGELVGVSTGFTFAKEHEQGIKPLYIVCGITPFADYIVKKRWWKKTKEPILGLERTTITKVNAFLTGMLEIDDKKYYVLGYNTTYVPKPEHMQRDFESWWDNRSFCIVSDNEKYMTKLIRHAYNQDLCFATGGKVFEGHSGIRLLIKSKVSKEVYNSCLEEEKSQYRLKMNDLELNMSKLLKNRIDDFTSINSYWKDEEKTEVHWWLKPAKEEEYEFAGFYTLSELKSWNKGLSLKEINELRKENI